MSMKISVWSSYYYEISPEDMVLEFEKFGYHYCELSSEHTHVLMERGDAATVGAAFKTFADAHGVAFLQGHLMLEAKIGSKDCIDTLKRQLDLYIAIGIKAAVLHVDVFRDNPTMSIEEKCRINKEALVELTTYIANTDVAICLENLCESPAASVEELLYFIDTIQSDNLGICLDTGHLNLTDNRNQKHFIRTAGKHLKALHIADNEGKTDQHVMPFGCGKVDIREVISELKAIGYDGLYNLEIPNEKWAPMEIRGFKLEYIKKTYDYLDSVL